MVDDGYPLSTEIALLQDLVTTTSYLNKALEGMNVQRKVFPLFLICFLRTPCLLFLGEKLILSTAPMKSILMLLKKLIQLLISQEFLPQQYMEKSR